MGIIISIILGCALSLTVFLWVNGIDSMKKNHPDYKGEDLFNEEEQEDEEENIPR